MKPLQVAARFAAFAWYTSYRQASSQIVQKEARRFAQEHWVAFLPIVHEGLGKLLLRVAHARSTRRGRLAAGYRPTRHKPTATV